MKQKIRLAGVVMSIDDAAGVIQRDIVAWYERTHMTPEQVKEARARTAGTRN